MGRQKLINLHNEGNNAKPKVADIEFGEIAVNHAPGNEKLWIKTGENTIADFCRAKLPISAKITTKEAMDGFIEGGYMKYANFSVSGSNTGLAGDDGMILSIPWTSTGYGAQIAFEDDVNTAISVRSRKNQNTWTEWKKLAFKTDILSIPSITINDTGSGNAVTDVTASGHTLTLARGKNFSEVGHTHDRILNGSYGAKITSNGYFMPVAGNEHIGMQNDPWDKAYISEIVGNLTGTATNSNFLLEGSSRKWKVNYSGADINDGVYLAVMKSDGINSEFRTAERSKINVGSASKWLNPITLTLSGDLSGSVSIDGSKNVTLSGSVRDDSHYHSYDTIQRGYSNVSGGVFPIDRSLIDSCSGPKTAFMDGENIKVEYTYDGGKTWSDSGLSNTDKMGLFSLNRSYSVGLGAKTPVKVGQGVRITAIPKDRYAVVDTFYCWFGSAGHSCSCKIETSTLGSPDNFVLIKDFVPVSGWSGPNEIQFGGRTFGGYSGQNANTFSYRFTFIINKISENYKDSRPSVTDLRLYGDELHVKPNNMSFNNHMYSWDIQQNVIFPKSITSSGFIKSGYSDSYVLKAGGGAELESSLSVSSAKNFIDTGGRSFNLTYTGTGEGEASANYLACFSDNGKSISCIQPGKLSVKSATNDGSGNNISSTYLKKSGGTFTGPINFPSNTALPQSNKLEYVTGITGFGDSTHGQLQWQSASEFVKQYVPGITITDNTEGAFITNLTASGHTITVTRTNKIDCGTFDPQP